MNKNVSFTIGMIYLISVLGINMWIMFWVNSENAIYAEQLEIIDSNSESIGNDLGQDADILKGLVVSGKKAVPATKMIINGMFGSFFVACLMIIPNLLRRHIKTFDWDAFNKYIIIFAIADIIIIGISFADLIGYINIFESLMKPLR